MGGGRSKLEDSEQLQNRIRGRQKILLGRFQRQKLLVLGGKGHGKSSVINSFNYVANLAANSNAEYFPYAEIGSGQTSKTKHFREYSACTPKGFCKELNEELRKRVPTFYDTCGIPNRSNYADLIKALAEGAVAVETCMQDLVDAPKKICQYMGEVDPDVASWVILFVVSAVAPIENNLMQELQTAISTLERIQKGAKFYQIRSTLHLIIYIRRSKCICPYY